MAKIKNIFFNIDATDIGYGCSMNGIHPTGIVTIGNVYFIKLNNSINENNPKFNTLIFLPFIIISIFTYIITMLNDLYTNFFCCNKKQTNY
jgi:hypothetical protein